MNIALIIVLLIVIVGGTIMIWREGAPVELVSRGDHLHTGSNSDATTVSEST